MIDRKRLIAWGLVVAGVLFVYWLGRREAHRSAAEQAWQERVESLLATSRPFHRRMADLAAAARRAGEEADLRVARARAWRDSAEARDTTIHRLEVLVAHAATIRPGSEVDSLLQAYRAQTASQQLALAELTLAVGAAQRDAELEGLRATAALARGDSLEALLRSDPRRCRILFVQCPSRTVAFVGGVGTVLVVREVLKALSKKS